MGTGVNKVKLLKIWEILSKESDENSPISTSELIGRLKKWGIDCDRRTLYLDIESLNEFGYEVICRKGHHSNGYFVVNREFEVSELKILMDAVQAASFVTKKKTDIIIDKLAALGGSFRGKLLKENLVEFSTLKHTNENIMYNIFAIEESIIDGVKLSFVYYDFDENCKKVLRKEGKRYILSAVATVFCNDNYYLLGNHDNHDGVTVYRVDRMMEVKKEQESSKEVSTLGERDIKERKESAFSMYLGESVNVKFVVDRSIIDVIVDKFGEGTRFLTTKDGGLAFEAVVQMSPTFVGWCLSFGEHMKVIAPDSVVQKIQDSIDCLSKLYNKA